MPDKTISDAELCELLEISYGTLYNRIKEGPPTKRHKNVPDLREIGYTVKKGQRRWFLDSVNDFLNRSK